MTVQAYRGMPKSIWFNLRVWIFHSFMGSTNPKAFSAVGKYIGSYEVYGWVI